MEVAFSLFPVCVSVDHPALKEYCCVEPWPDICICGQVWNYSGCNLRKHCSKCKGAQQRNSLAYEIQRLEIEFGIHYSWLEMGFTSALKILNGK